MGIQNIDIRVGVYTIRRNIGLFIIPQGRSFEYMPRGVYKRSTINVFKFNWFNNLIFLWKTDRFPPRDQILGVEVTFSDVYFAFHVISHLRHIFHKLVAFLLYPDVKINYVITQVVIPWKRTHLTRVTSNPSLFTIPLNVPWTPGNALYLYCRIIAIGPLLA